MTDFEALLNSIITQRGENVLELSKKQKLVMVFLRHFGCIFCREALNEIAELESKMQELNTKIIMVHMSSEPIAKKYFERFHIGHLDRVSDPDCTFYRGFGILKGTFNQLFGFRSWIRGIDAGIIKGHGWGVQLGDGFQMPGVFTIHKGKIISEFRHKYASDKPDYLELVSCSE
jgi:peroxiredoxin